MAIKGKSIKQSVLLPGTPKQVYQLLMTSKGHTAFTGAKASISGRIDGVCHAWDGYCEARNVQLEPGLLIVQAWRASDWPEGWWSTVSIDLASAPKGGCKLSFSQKQVPPKQAAAIAKGWHEFYWEPLKAYLLKHPAK